jgi:hypothetical protein
MIRIYLRVPDVIGECLTHDGTRAGQQGRKDSGRAVVALSALRVYLNRQRYPATLLDMSDEQWRELPGETFEDKVLGFTGRESMEDFPRARRHKNQ